MVEEETKVVPLTEQLAELKEQMNEGKNKKLRFPSKAKVSKAKMKKGWVGILKVDENGNLSGEKQQIEDSAYRTKDGIIHTTDGREMLFWNGKFPVFVQEAKKLNPKNFKFNEEGNEVYGQKYREAKLLKDTIKVKGKGMNMGVILVVLIVVVIGYVLGKYVFHWF